MNKSGQVKKRVLRHFSSGEIIFQEGEKGNEMYIIQSGEVEVIKQVGEEEIALARLKKNDFFGEMALLDNKKRSATVKAITDTAVVVVSKSIFLKQFQKVPEWFAKMFQVMSDRILAMDKQIKSTFKMGVQFSILNLLFLIGEKYGNRTNEQIILSQGVLYEKIHEILGLSHLKIDKVIRDLEFVKLVKMNSFENIITILNYKKMESFIEFSIKVNKYSSQEKAKEELTDIDTETIGYFEKIYKLLIRNKETIFVI